MTHGPARRRIVVAMMTSKRLAAAVLASLLLMPSVSAQTPQQLFQQALSKEQAEGKLEDAIRLYENVVQAAQSDRALTARALLQIGRCYEKLGLEGARKSYERLIQDFADQKEAAAQARVRLSALLRSIRGASGTRRLTEIDDVVKWRDFEGMSPDGRKALLGDYSKGMNLAVYDVASRRVKLLTDLDWSTYWVCCGAWSPRNTAVAYPKTTWGLDAPVEVHVTSLDGQSRMIFRNDEHPGRGVVVFGWHPDGGRLFVLRGQKDGSAAIGTIPATGGSFSPIRPIRTTVSSQNPFSDEAALSPDGRFVAFSESEGRAPRDIRVVSADGSREHRVTDHPGDDAKPLWSPDGRHLAFISNRSGSFALWAVAMKGGEPAGAPFKIKDGMQEVSLLNWTSRGIVYRQDTHTYNVLTSDRDPSAGGKWSAPAPLAYPRSGRNMGAAWSPDGTQLAFIESAQTQWDRRYVVLQPAGGGPTREFLIPTTQDGTQQAPTNLRWFGNGEGLGFPGADSNRARVIFRLTLASGEWQVLPAPFKANVGIEWNDDGSAFYYVREVGIWEHDIKTGADRLIYAPNERFTSIRSLRVSANRQWLGFIQRALLEGTPTAEKATAMVLNLATGERRALATARQMLADLNEPWLQGYTWAPQDSALGLLMLMPARREYQIRLAPLDGSPVHALEELPLPARTSDIGSVDWSSDGRHVAFSVRQTPSDAFVIENPLAEATAAARTVRR